MWVLQSTAATIIVGPILDSTGAEYTGAVIGDLSISKNGGTLTAMAAAATLTHIANGQYTLVTTTGNLDTLGRAQITCNKSTYQMPPVNLMVTTANVYNSLVLGTDKLDGAVVEWNGVALGTTNPLPNAAPNAATGLLTSTAGSLDMDALNTAAVRFTAARATLIDGITAARMGALTDWIDGGRLDLLLDAIQTDLDNGTDGLGALKALIDTLTTTIGTAGDGLTNITLANDLSATMKTSVQTAMDAAIDTAIAELGVGAPTATPTLRTGLMLLYMALRNKVDATSSTLEVHNDAGTIVASKALTDDGTTYSEAEMVSG